MAGATGSVRGAEPLDPAGVEFFEKHIRPVLVQHCYECHQGDEVQGGLHLDSRQGWQVGGDTGPAIVPGKPDESLLIRALRYDSDHLQMPPEGKLPEEVVRHFEQWVRLGAPDPRVDGTALPRQEIDIEAGRQWWAYQPPRHHPAPQVRGAQWPHNDVDRFILARLEAQGLRPAEDADRRTLIRRLYFDLIGLPPEPEAIEAFVRDSSPDAYERLVDQLLASPHFGERWGRHWLDVVRYAESLTLRGFVLGEAWRYRDYCIDTFNQDRPYNEFLMEQVAGDLLPADTLEQRQRRWIATTFLMLGNTNLEEQDKKQLDMDVVDEQLDTIGKAFLAQTIGCARCHDHKFDPIPTRDYYAMAGILKNVRTLNHDNVSKWIEMPLPLEAEQEALVQQHEEQVRQLQQQIARHKDQLKVLAGGSAAQAASVSVAEVPGIVVDDAQARKVGTWQASQHVQGFVGTGYVHDENQGKGEKTITFLPELPADGRYEVRLSYTPGTNRAARVPVTIFSADGEKLLHLDQRKAPPIDGRFISLGQYRFEKAGQSFVMVSNEGTQGHVIADCVQFVPVEELDKLAAVSKTADDPAAKEESQRLAAAVKQLEEELKRLQAQAPPRPKVITVIENSQCSDIPVHIRGNVHTLGEVVPRGFLQVASVSPPAPISDNESGRRQLAQWLASPENPLPARVMVNRVWHWLFGEGLVRTPDNFGRTGELPSHPELLDELAVRFMADGWSVKRLIRTLVLSRTYRLSSRPGPEALAADPENRLWSRANRRRLDAECLRDAMLSVAGTLKRDAGGPSFPANLSSDYDYKYRDTRRSVYVPVFRNALPELFEAFDFADPSLVVGRRTTSTVAPQALFLMNHPFVFEQAQQAAARLLADASAGDDAVRVELAFQMALGRPPTDAERTLTLEHLAAAAAGDSPTAHRNAWTGIFHTLFASIDFRYLD